MAGGILRFPRPSFAVLVACILFSFHPQSRGAGARALSRDPLQLSAESGRFKVALLADLHYGEAAWTDWGPAQDSNSTRAIASVLDHETPDFVIYLGDVITANNLPVHNATLYWDQAISPTRSRGIPWASVFGNHDDMPFGWPDEWFSPIGIPQTVCYSDITGKACSFRGTSRMDLMSSEIKNNMLSYSINGPKKLWPGVSNYVLQVLSSQDPGSPVLFLYFLDSGGGSYPEIISSAQAKWFQLQSHVINPGGRIPEIVFWHIPSIAYKNIAPTPKTIVHKPCVGSINKESVAAQEAEWGIMDILVSRPSVKAVFVGHNHGLDWCCPYESLWLCFARHSGYGGYGDWPRGARIIEITENPFILKTWIRMEDGTKHSEFILNGDLSTS